MLLRRFLIQPDHVPSWIFESRCDFGRIRPNRLHDLAAVRLNGLDRLLDAVYHDVEQQAWRGRWWASLHERAADFADGIIECSRAVAPLAHVPAENLLVEIRRALNVGCG